MTLTTTTTPAALLEVETFGVNVLIGPAVRESDRDLFFGPLEENLAPFLELPPETTLADLVVTLGLMPSKGQARKNGWGGPIPDGFSEHRFGKKRVAITILKILVEPEPESVVESET